MKALVYRKSVPRYLACALAARLAPRRFFPRLAPLGLAEVPFDPPRGWLPLTPLLCGICGSDLGLLRGAESVLLEPYASLPFVLGHEMVARLEADAPQLGLAAGARVVAEPGLPCEVRELPPCRPCRQGRSNRCERFLDGELPPGSFLGFTARAGGAMAERTAAHPSRLLPVPDGLGDEEAVLTDSLASALQPVLEHFPAPGSLVLVTGAGILGQHVVRCLRALRSTARVLVAARHRGQADLAIAGGADGIVRARNRRELAAALGARYLPTSLGGGNIEGGADTVFDCVGSSRTFEDGLLCLRAGGTYVMVGAGARLKNVDISSLWFRELTVAGSSGCALAPDPRRPGTMVRTYALALELLASGRYPTAGLLSHRFPLECWREAFACAFDKRASGSVKVAFDLR
ncbi:zinc-binding dehydrogenase [Solidesulfovibrio sp.]|uniref:zinc-dependent alcohol dehydrogenase n=1 Tax=Solidesulfovibrio sp. TaxID=2910990 RepID=UPI002B1EAA74|nr:zinc-binding dehydrogenase [Solidesulfovibrio sp.]MEA4856323.1 zinc-binding dehydrogenase [Solidesulfovibrio sp.]